MHSRNIAAAHNN